MTKAGADRNVTEPGDSERLRFYWEQPSTLGEARAALRRSILANEAAREEWARREAQLCSSNGKLANELDRRVECVAPGDHHHIRTAPMDKTSAQIRDERAGMMIRTVAAIQDHCARIVSDMAGADGLFRLPDRGSVDKVEYLAGQLDTDWREMAESDPFMRKDRDED